MKAWIKIIKKLHFHSLDVSSFKAIMILKGFVFIASLKATQTIISENTIPFNPLRTEGKIVTMIFW